MILAQGTGSTPWWQSVPLGVVVAALIAAWVTVRTARKTPHENLKVLSEIRGALEKEMAAVDPRSALDKAIRLEIDNLEKLNVAREKGTIAYLRESAAQRWALVFVGSTAIFLILGLASLAAFFYLDVYVGPNRNDSLITFFLFGAVVCFMAAALVTATGLTLLVSRFLSYRRSRHREKVDNSLRADVDSPTRDGSLTGPAGHDSDSSVDRP
ncbi:hypothetical protein ACFWAY_17735 [Rhodococcus sp. NPDC059968]|uniref:hypothetical protein n=1 Tax=Rhodococcus sp. NPDC059968 TaxID=3347017 RepID=UPI00366FBB94